MLRGQEARALAGCPRSFLLRSVTHSIHKLVPNTQTDRPARTAAVFGLWCQRECEDNVCKLQILPKHAPLLDFFTNLTTQRRGAHAAHALARPFIQLQWPSKKRGPALASLESGSEERCCP